MAKSYTQLVDVMEILKEAIRLPRRNAEIFLIIAISTMIPCSLLGLAYGFSTVSLISDLSMSMLSLFSIKDPTSTVYHNEMYKIRVDSILLILEYIIYVVLTSMILLSSTASTVYVSAMSYLGKDMTLKDLWLKLKMIWVRPLLTWFYISLMITSAVWFISFVLAIVFMGKRSIIIVVVGSVLVLLVMCVNMYLVLIWMLSFVTSVLEDCCGLAALGKAENLVKGKKVVGVVLTFIMFVVYSTVHLLSFVSKNPHKSVFQIFVMVLVMNLVSMVKILGMMVYTVFYFERKQSHGEPLALEEEMGYKSVPTTVLDSSAIP